MLLKVVEFELPNAVVIEKLAGRPSVPGVVKLNLPTPPVETLVTVMIPFLALLNVQVTVPPATTVKLAGLPTVHEELPATHPVGESSVTE